MLAEQIKIKEHLEELIIEFKKKNNSADIQLLEKNIRCIIFSRMLS